jgi:hypothetical protein
MSGYCRFPKTSPCRIFMYVCSVALERQSLLEQRGVRFHAQSVGWPRVPLVSLGSPPGPVLSILDVPLLVLEIPVFAPPLVPWPAAFVPIPVPYLVVGVSHVLPGLRAYGLVLLLRSRVCVVAPLERDVLFAESGQLQVAVAVCYLLVRYPVAAFPAMPAAVWPGFL